MNKKQADILPVRPAWVVIFWLIAALCECRGGVANGCPQPLLPAEQAILNQLTNQAAIDLSTNDTGVTTLAERTLRGKFFEWLLTTQGAQLGHDGLSLKNAVIAGPVDLSNEDVPVPVDLICCHFQDKVNLTSTHFAHDLTFAGCLFTGALVAPRLQVDGLLELKSYTLKGAWKTSPAEVPPTDTDFKNYLATNQTIQTWSPGRREFVPDPDQLVRTWQIDDPRTSEVTNHWTNRFAVTTWGDRLFLVQKNTDVPARAAIGAVNLTVGPLTNRWKLRPHTGALDLDSVRPQLATALNTNLEFVLKFVLTTNAAVTTASVRWAFDQPASTEARPLVAKWFGGASVNFSQPTVFRSAVFLDGATVAGKLNAEEVEFRMNLGCHSLKVGDAAVMSDARFDDATSFFYAQVRHDFLLKDSRFKKSFDATGMVVGGSLILDGTRFGDRADFDVVSVGNDFKGQYVRFENGERLAEFRGLKVDGMVDLLRAQFAGPANFILAHIKGNFQAPGATFGDTHSFIELQNLTSDSFTFNTDFGSMQVDGFAIFENALFARSVSFRNARFANLYLDGTRWPTANRLLAYTNDPGPQDLLRLEGMDFDTIRDVTSGHFLHTHAQLEESQTNLLNMFARRAPYSFDVYARLEHYFQREGAPVLADGVFINAKERERQEVTSLPAKAANLFLDLTVGYGRKPLLAFSESVVCILIWGLLCKQFMVRKTSARQTPGLGLALFFSLGTFLPIIDLGAAGLLEFGRGKEWFHYLIALEKILGYILVPLWTMALTGLIK